MEVIKEEAEALQPGWSESIVQEAHWLHQNVNDEKKVAAETQAKQKAQIEAMQKAQKVAVEAKKAAEPPKVRRASEGGGEGAGRVPARRGRFPSGGGRTRVPTWSPLPPVSAPGACPATRLAQELSDADRAKVVKALEAEAEREAAKGGAVKRKGSGKDKGKK